MKIGIVGAEAKKFTPETERSARMGIRQLIAEAELVISGHSPLGGIDWWAIEEADKLGIATREYAPTTSQWDGPGGFKERNLAIADASDVVVCIVPKVLPEGYRGRRFPQGCYHCHTLPDNHVKSGGCWTMHQAEAKGKQTFLVIIE
jgi:hypothetical protein